MTLKVAIVGCGAIADSHVEEIRKLSGVEIVAVCDREPIMAEQLAERYRIDRTYSDFSAMLADTAPDVVHITTPPQSHLPLAMEAIDAGAHVLVEKPVAIDASDTERLLTHAQRHGRKLTAGHSYQFDPPALELRRLVARGTLGTIVHVDSHFGYNLEGGFGRAVTATPSHWVHDLPGNLPHNNISHALAKVVEFMPGDDPHVAVTARRSDPRYGDVRDRIIEELRVIIEDGPFSACVTFSCAVRPVAHWVRVCGTRNTASANYISRAVTLERKPALPSALGRMLSAFSQGWEFDRAAWKNLYRFLRYRFHFQAGVNELFQRFYASIREDTDPPIPYRDILLVARLMDDIFAAVNREDDRR
jgi:predicted dehydrogenase